MSTHTMKKNDYRRVRASEGKKEIDDSKPVNEIRVSAKGRTSTYISYASTLFAPSNPLAEAEEDKSKPKLDPTTLKPFTTITFKATGAALSTVVTVVEIVKRRFKGVEQITKLGSFEIEDEYEPKSKEDGLENIKQKRSVSFIEITLCREKNKLDKKDKGYQPSLPDSEIEELTVEEMLNPRSRRNQHAVDGEDDEDEDGEKKTSRKGKGKGKKGKGKGKGKGKDGKRSSTKGSKGKGKGKGKGKKDDDEKKSSETKDSESKPKKSKGKGKAKKEEKKEE